MDEVLRAEVRFLTTRLGALVREHSGERVFAAIERLRSLSKQIRQEPKPNLLAANRMEVEGLRLDEATAVAHAFSLFFHLVNLCEERQRVRRLDEYEREPAGAPMSLRRTFSELRQRRAGTGRLARLLGSMRIEPVLTAHPTEAKRRSVINHLLRIDRTLEALDGRLGPVAERAVDPWIEALWLTDEVRQRAVTPGVELENTLVYFERTIYDLAGVFWGRLQEELEKAAPGLAVAPFIRFGSWVGGDRDGNPNVTPETSLGAAEELRRSVLNYYMQSCERLLGIVSLPCRPARLARRLQRSLEADRRKFPATRAFEELDQPDELYRRKLRVIQWRLGRARTRTRGAYQEPEEFIADLRLVEELLEQHPSPRVAAVGPRRLRVAAEVFGFHGATLDFRQHSSATRAAADELLRAAGLPGEPAAKRIASILRLLRGRAVRRRVPSAAQRTLAEFGTLARIQERHGEEAAHRYIVSMTSRAADVWDVLLLARQAGLVRGKRGGRLESRLDVIPLFETFEDLQAAPKILDQLLADPAYRAHLKSRSNFQEVLLGYSDSVKDSGYLAANWALVRAQKRLGEVAARRGVRLGLFHGKGGTIDRGGGLSYRSLQAQPSAAPGGRIRITEQGEVISLKYSNPAIALRNLEQLAVSVLDAHLLGAESRPTAKQLSEWEAAAGELAATSRDFYRALVYETPEFPRYFYQATPIDLIEQLRLGSRPARRYRTDDLRALRAIPWVFAWTQSRHMLPAWYGLGYALERFAQKARGLEQLRAMGRGWPFFSVLLENAEASLAKTDLYIARRYAELARPAALRERIFGRIEEEHRRSCRWVLEVSGTRELLAEQPVLAQSIRQRNPYVDPLNHLQLRFLEEWRGTRRPRPALLHLLQMTVTGIAFGMKSTG